MARKTAGFKRGMFLVSYPDAKLRTSPLREKCVAGCNPPAAVKIGSGYEISMFQLVRRIETSIP